jgi:hypothetical protein
MKTKLFLAALCIFLLPLFFAHSSQFSANASGYMISSGVIVECECEEGPGYHEDCRCDGASLTDPESNTASSLGSESLLVFAAVMLWLRLRA